MKNSRDYKLLARQRMSTKYGTLAGATVIYAGIYVTVIFVLLFAYAASLLSKGVFNSLASMQQYMMTTSSDLLFSVEMQVVLMLVTALMTTFLAGIQYMCLNVARGKDIKISDMFYAIKNNPDKIIIISIIQSLLVYVFSVPVDILAVIINGGNDSVPLEIVYFAFTILSYVADIIIVTLFSQAAFIYIDDPMCSVVACIETSARVMKKNMFSYIFLWISFLPISILAAFTMGILYIWVIPYQNTAFALFYMKLKGELGSTIDVTVQ